MAKDDEEKEAEAKGGKKKLVIILVPVLLLVAAAGWFFFLRPKDDAGAVEALPEPTPGAVVKLDAITVNLAEGHFLKLGMAIQPTATAKEVDGSKALDLAISQFSQMTMDDLTTTEGRTTAKEHLVARIKLAYLPEGTDLATATGETAEPKPAETKSESKTETKAKEPAEKDAEIHVADLSDEQVTKMAEALTVQPDVYDVYFTEFVMQ